MRLVYFDSVVSFPVCILHINNSDSRKFFHIQCKQYDFRLISRLFIFTHLSVKKLKLVFLPVSQLRKINFINTINRPILYYTMYVGIYKIYCVSVDTNCDDQEKENITCCIKPV